MLWTGARNFRQLVELLLRPRFHGNLKKGKCMIFRTGSRLITNRNGDHLTGAYTYIHTYRHTDRQTHIQTHRQTHIYTHKHRHTQTHTHSSWVQFRAMCREQNDTCNTCMKRNGKGRPGYFEFEQQIIRRNC